MMFEQKGDEDEGGGGFQRGDDIYPTDDYGLWTMIIEGNYMGSEQVLCNENAEMQCR
mgnify:CR=1 FL=1